MKWGLECVRLEWKPQDCWIGVFWRVSRYVMTEEPYAVDIWICFVPMLPLHISIWKERPS